VNEVGGPAGSEARADYWEEVCGDDTDAFDRVMALEGLRDAVSEFEDAPPRDAIHHIVNARDHVDVTEEM